MKRVMVAGALAAVAVTTVIFGIMYAEQADSRSVARIALDYRTPLGDYEVLHADKYELELPADWQSQSSNVLSDLETDGIIREATGGRVHDNKFYGHAEPESLADGVFPTNIMIHTAESDLAQDEYEGALLDIMAASETHYGIDVRILDSRWGELGGRPAITMEYTIGDTQDSDLPTIKAVETITVTGSTMYSISYGSEIDGYYENLHHFDHAVKTFKFR